MDLFETTGDGNQNRPYQSYIAARARRNPCLQYLSKFLADGSQSRRKCRTACLKFSSSSSVPTSRILDLEDLAGLLQEIKRNDSLRGRILIIEDLSKDVIELLGSILDIDPFFFASHINALQSDIITTKPYMATLPSTTKSRNFLNLHYHRVLRFDLRPSQGTLLRDMNVPRKVTILPSIKNVEIGLARHCCSILRTMGKDGLWLGTRTFMNFGNVNVKTYPKIGLILVDISLDHSFIVKSQDYPGTKEVALQSSLFQGGFENFLPDTFLHDNVLTSGNWHRSLFEGIDFFWKNEQPQEFDTKNPSLISLSYYPLKVVAAEWMTYLQVMYHSTKEYEYVPNAVSGPMEQLEILNNDLSALQRWNRRNMATAYKLRYVNAFLKSCCDHHRNICSCTGLMDDYEHIASMVDSYNRRLEITVPIVTSLIQIIDSQLSLKEAANITRLTYLAMVFVLLTFVASLFSMNDTITSGNYFFWLWFAVAIPLCALVFLIARPPAKMFKFYQIRGTGMINGG